MPKTGSGEEIFLFKDFVPFFFFRDTLSNSSSDETTSLARVVLTTVCCLFKKKQLRLRREINISNEKTHFV